MKATTVGVAGRRLQLLPQKAAYLEDRRTLLVADLHVGKAVTFRRLGVPVPRGTTSETLSVLGELVQATGAERVIVLGDLLHGVHAHAPSTLGAFARWRAAHAALDVVLVRGNHDDRAGDPPASLRITVVDEPLVDDGLVFCHHPGPRAEGHVIAGHLHPCIGLGGPAYDRLRLPCWWLGERISVLPAFGSFTGMHPIRPRPGDRVYVTDGEAVRVVPGLHTA